jgi:EAL domain-containing protein (putative c-di-GMP-specific phosphodiesterase class I)
VRWNHPEHGLLAEAEFLSVAQGAGLMTTLGRWMRRDGLAALQRLRSATSALENGEFVLWFKLAAEELQDGFVSWLVSDAAALGIAASSIGVEVEAHSPTGVFEAKLKVLSELREQGFRILLSEVSANHGAIRSLSLLPADAIKLEAAIVSQVDDPDMIVRGAVNGVLSAMGQLAEALDVKLMACKIERESELLTLRESGFFAGSGLLVSPAVPEADLAQVLEGLYKASL